jgi:anthranilate synthase component II
VHLIEKADDAKVEVFLNDNVKIEDLHRYDGIVLSPGPGLPEEAGLMPAVIKEYFKTKPILGVCLGMQGLAQFFGARLMNLETVMHGIATLVTHTGKDFLFENIPATFMAGRYHSWVADAGTFPPELEMICRDEQGNAMAMRHKNYNIRGVQFHPESILSEHGERLMKNWLDHL